MPTHNQHKLEVHQLFYTSTCSFKVTSFFELIVVVKRMYVTLEVRVSYCLEMGANKSFLLCEALRQNDERECKLLISKKKVNFTARLSVGVPPLSHSDGALLTHFMTCTTSGQAHTLHRVC